MTADIRIIATAKDAEAFVQAVLAVIPGATVAGRCFARRRTQVRVYIHCPETPAANPSALGKAPDSDIPQHPPPLSPTR